jgi:hypothetical protein
LLKPRKNKSFSYTPRFSKETESNSDKKETSNYRNFSSKWKNSEGLSKHKLKKGLSLPILLLVLVVVLICMYLLEIKAK